MDLENQLKRMVIIMKVIGLKIKDKDKDYLYGLTVINMRVNGQKIKDQEKVYLNHKTEIMMVIGFKINEMVKGQ